jgi:outer membrane protein assembly factor BamB
MHIKSSQSVKLEFALCKEATLSGSRRWQPECRAYVYSSPTVADLDHDGKLEVIIGTSVGFLYVLDHFGQLKPGWPRQMGDIQAQVAVADVNGDGYLELLALDSRGSAAMFNATGTLLWDQHVSSPLSQVATFGDINGDGRLEAVFGAASGEVFAFDAISGVCLPDQPPPPCCSCLLSTGRSAVVAKRD